MTLENISSDSIYLSDNAPISAEIFNLTQEKYIQEQALQSLLAQNPSSALVSEIKSEKKHTKTKIALIGFMFGMVLSIILVFFIGVFKKAYKEENAIAL